MIPKVSVIIPVFNSEKYLGPCLDSILNQTLHNIEIICVDDDSKDNSLEILNQYAKNDNRVKVLHQVNSGPGPARNRALKIATGEFIIFLDSDDFFDQNMLSSMVTTAEKDNSDIVICGHVFFDNVSGVDFLKRTVEPKWFKRSPINPKDYPDELFFCQSFVWEKLIRHSLLKEHNVLFYPTMIYQEDIPYTYNLMTLAKKISILSNTFVHYRKQRSDSLTKIWGLKDDLFFKPWILLWEELEKSRTEKYYLNSYKNALLREIAWAVSDRHPKEARILIKYFFQNMPCKILERCDFLNKNTKISIIIPIYNAANFLPRCLDSCLNQTLKAIEIICVDDGSTDNTLKILNQYAKKDERIKIIHQENEGTSIAREKATKVAEGEYIQFLDATDWIEVDTCGCLYMYSKIYSLDMLSFAASEFNDAKRELINSYYCLTWLPTRFPSVFCWKQVAHILPQLAVTGPLTLYRRNYLNDKKVHWINKKITHADTLFFTEALLKGARMGAFPVRFYHKYINPYHSEFESLLDYCQIVKYTLKRIQKIIGKKDGILIQYIHVLSQKIYNDYSCLEEQEQIRIQKNLFALYFYLIKKYHIQFPKNIKDMCRQSLKKNKIMIIPYFFYEFLACFFRSSYTINLVSLKLSPWFSLKVLGLSIVDCQLLNVDSNVNHALKKKQGLFLKILGLKICKIRGIQTDAPPPMLQF